MSRLLRGKPRIPLRSVGLVLAGVALSACGSSISGFAPFAVLQANTQARTVQLTLDASATGANGGLNFDGYADGALQVNVPVGWTVQVSCDNGSSTISPSCAIVDDRSVTTTAPPIAFTGASIPNPTSGLVLGGSETFTFVASSVGRYRIASLAQGDAAGGMWDWFVITAGGRPSVRT